MFQTLFHTSFLYFILDSKELYFIINYMILYYLQLLDKVNHLVTFLFHCYIYDAKFFAFDPNLK